MATRHAYDQALNRWLVLFYPSKGGLKRGLNVRFGSKADICKAKGHVRFTPNSDRESGFPQNGMSALHPKADMCVQLGMSALGQKRTSTFSCFDLLSAKDANLRQ
jgi:hypothetical protein